MNRRGFLKGFVGAVAGAALAEELSTRSIFLPPRGGWWANTVGAPAFLTNYVDPKILEVLIKPIGETDAQFVRRLLSRSNRK